MEKDMITAAGKTGAKHKKKEPAISHPPFYLGNAELIKKYFNDRGYTEQIINRRS